MQIDTRGHSHLAVKHLTDKQRALPPDFGAAGLVGGVRGASDYSGSPTVEHTGPEPSLLIFQMRRSVRLRTKARVDATYVEGSPQHAQKGLVAREK